MALQTSSCIGVARAVRRGQASRASPRGFVGRPREWRCRRPPRSPKGTPVAYENRWQQPCGRLSALGPLLPAAPARALTGRMAGRGSQRQDVAARWSAGQVQGALPPDVGPGPITTPPVTCNPQEWEVRVFSQGGRVMWGGEPHADLSHPVPELGQLQTRKRRSGRRKLGVFFARGGRRKLADHAVFA